MAFPKYESYKDSGVEWLGKIPSHWLYERGKFVFFYKKELNSKMQCRNLLALTLNGVINKDIDSGEGLRPENYSTYQVFEEGNLVFKLIDLENFQTSRVGIVHEKGIMSPVYIRLIKGSKYPVYQRYFYYLYYSFYQRGVYNAIGAGVRSALTAKDLLEMEISIPPLEEQQRIVTFLDRTTVEIDEAIAKKQRLIKLLQEQKAILINQAVTKGLNPKAPMRDSGVEWIGEIPEHWATAKIKHIAKFYSGGTPSKEKAEFWDGDIPWVSPKDMKLRYIKDTEDKITQKALKKTTIKLLDTNAVLIVVRGMILARKIPVALTCFPVTINQDMKALLLDVHCLPEYLVFLIEGVNKNLSTLLEESGHGTKTLPTEKLGAFVVPIPPKDEQVNIINFIKENDAQTDSSIATINKQVLLLEEFRCNIIASAVTGKIKVQSY